MYDLLHLWNDEVKHVQVFHGATVHYVQEIVRRMYRHPSLYTMSLYAFSL